MRLLDFVEQHDRVRPAPHSLGQRARIFVADVSRRRADQPRHGELLHVLAHVDADQRIAIGEQELRQRARQLRLTDAGRTAEDEAADRPLRILQARAAAPDRAADRLDRFVLADHPLVQLVLHVDQALGLGLTQARNRNASPTAHDEADIVFVDRRPVRLALLLPLFLLLVDLALQLALRVAQLRRALEVLIADRRFLLAAHALPADP